MAVGVFGMSSAAKLVLCSGLGSALHRHRWLWSSVLQCSRQAATDALTVSMTAEWKSVLTTPEDMCKQEYWAGEQAYWSPESARKVRAPQTNQNPSTRAPLNAEPGPASSAGVVVRCEAHHSQAEAST